jgi:site-specific DNA-methyltransferase (adenine-specific)
MELNQIKNIDCQQFLPTIQENFVDLILTDPPYGIDIMGAKWDRGKIDKLIEKSKKSTVKGLPVGMKFNPEDAVKLQKFLEPIFFEYFRILKPGGFCMIFSQSRSSHRVALALENSGFEIREQLFWDYGLGQQKAQSVSNFIKKNKKITEEQKNVLLKKLENKKTPQLAPKVETIWLAQKPKEGNTVDNYIKWGTGLVNFNNETVKVSFEFSKPNTNERNLLHKHPTQKPVALLEELIKRFSDVNDIVMDSFGGSGSTYVACKNTSRYFIGCEIDPIYYEIIKDRLK